MGNCTTCDDPNIYESRNELKPAKKAPDNQENISVKPKLSQSSQLTQHIRSNLKPLSSMPDFSNAYTLEALNRVGPY